MKRPFSPAILCLFSILLAPSTFSQAAAPAGTLLQMAGGPPGGIGACQIQPAVICESTIPDEQACAAAGARYHGSRWGEEVDCLGIRQRMRKKPYPNGVCFITKDTGVPCQNLSQKACEVAANSRGAKFSWLQGLTCGYPPGRH